MQKETLNIINDFARIMDVVENMNIPDLAANISEVKRMIANVDEEGLKAKLEELKQKENHA